MPRCLRRCREVEARIHVQNEPAVGVHVRPEQRREGAAILVCHPLEPLRFGEDLLEQQGVDVDEGRLQEVQGQDGDLLGLAIRPGELAALAVEEDGVCAVPRLDDLLGLSRFGGSPSFSVRLEHDRWRV